MVVHVEAFKSGLVSRVKAVVDGRFQFQERDSLHGVAIIELQMASNAMAESNGRPQHCCLSHPDQNSLDGRGEVVSLVQNSPKITLHDFERTIQPKTLDMSSLRYSYVVLHHVFAFRLT